MCPHFYNEYSIDMSSHYWINLIWMFLIKITIHFLLLLVPNVFLNRIILYLCWEKLPCVIIRPIFETENHVLNNEIAKRWRKPIKYWIPSMVEKFLHAAKSLHPCFVAYKNPTSVKNFLIGWVTFGSKLYSHWANVLEVKVIGT